MATRAFELYGEIFLKDDKTADKLSEIDKKAEKAGNGFVGLAKKIGTFILAGAAIKGVTNIVKDLTETYQVQERAENRLQTLMSNVPGTTQASIDSIKKYASELQGLSTIGDEVSISGASQLATFQMQASNIKTLMPAMNDLAVATYGANVSQEQMIQTGNLVGKVMQGQVGALSRVGVSFTAAQEEILKTGTEAQKTAALVEVLGANFGGLAETTAKTSEGAMIQIQNTWGDMKEVMGAKLIPIILDFVDVINEHMPQIQSVFETVMDSLGKAVDVVVIGIKEFINVIKWAKENSEILIPVLAGVLGAFIAFNIITTVSAMFKAFTIATEGMTIAQAALNAIMAINPFVLVAIAIGVLIAAGVALWKNWDTVKTKASELKDSVQTKFEQIKTAITTPITNAVETVRQKVQAIKDFFSNLKISIPKPKLPHFSISGKFDLIPPDISVPKLSVDWYAKGTGNFKGGLAGINEYGKGEIVNLPNGSQIIPHDVSMEMAKGSGQSPIVIQNMNVRNDNDIKLIARELYNLQQNKNRALGVV